MDLQLRLHEIYDGFKVLYDLLEDFVERLGVQKIVEVCFISCVLIADAVHVNVQAIYVLSLAIRANFTYDPRVLAI